MASKVVDIVTAKIIEQLEAGTIPWAKGWKLNEAPRNAITGKAYRGFNAFLLRCYPNKDTRYLTYRQAEGLGGNVKKGEKGIPIVFWNFNEKEKEDGTKEKSAFMRYYTVFNVDQCENLTKLKPLEEMINLVEEVKEVEQILATYHSKPRIVEGGDRAFYNPQMDYIGMPVKEQFNTTEDYYSTLLHEMVHSTGHSGRLGRLGDSMASAFGSESYSKEELVAEIGSAMLLSICGIENKISNSAAYIASWLKALNNDKSMIIKSASSAEKAVNFMLNIKEETQTQE